MNDWTWLAFAAIFAAWLAHSLLTLRYALSSEWECWRRLKKYL